METLNWRRRTSGEFGRSEDIEFDESRTVGISDELLLLVLTDDGRAIVHHWWSFTSAQHQWEPFDKAFGSRNACNDVVRECRSFSKKERFFQAAPRLLLISLLCCSDLFRTVISGFDPAIQRLFSQSIWRGSVGRRHVGLAELILAGNYGLNRHAVVMHDIPTITKLPVLSCGRWDEGCARWWCVSNLSRQCHAACVTLFRINWVLKSIDRLQTLAGEAIQAAIE